MCLDKAIKTSLINKNSRMRAEAIKQNAKSITIYQLAFSVVSMRKTERQTSYIPVNHIKYVFSIYFSIIFFVSFGILTYILYRRI